MMIIVVQRKLPSIFCF